VFILSGVIYAVVMIFFIATQIDVLKKDIPKIDMRDLGLIAFASIIDAFLANLLYYNVLRDHESYIVSALIFSSPVFTLLLAYLFLNEKITLMGALGVFFIILGVICVSTNTYKIEEFINYL
jgi:drug/metabolite transporter (DMT)-like permease